VHEDVQRSWSFGTSKFLMFWMVMIFFDFLMVIMSLFPIIYYLNSRLFISIEDPIKNSSPKKYLAICRIVFVELLENERRNGLRVWISVSLGKTKLS
jgi:hypothetical protein